MKRKYPYKTGEIDVFGDQVWCFEPPDEEYENESKACFSDYLAEGGELKTPQNYLATYLTEQYTLANIKEKPTPQEINRLQEIVTEITQNESKTHEQIFADNKVWEYVESLILQHAKDYKYVGVEVDGLLVYVQRFTDEQVTAGDFISKVLALAGQKEGEVKEINREQYENFSIIDVEEKREQINKLELKDLAVLEKYRNFNPGKILFQDKKIIVSRTDTYNNTVTNFPYKVYDAITKSLIGTVEIDNSDINYAFYTVVDKIDLPGIDICVIFDVIIRNLPDIKKGIALPNLPQTEQLVKHFSQQSKIITKKQFTLIEN